MPDVEREGVVHTAREMHKQQLLFKKAQYGIFLEDPPAAEKAAIHADMLDLPEDFDLASEELEAEPDQPSVVEGEPAQPTVLEGEPGQLCDVEGQLAQPAALEGEPEPSWATRSTSTCFRAMCRTPSCEIQCCEASTDMRVNRRASFAG